MKKLNILEMTKEQLLSLDPNEASWLLSGEEIMHIFRTLGSFWTYNYKSAKVGFHAELKSGLCSDGFFYSKIALKYPNIRRIIAETLVKLYELDGFEKPDTIAGIPNGAYELGKEIADCMEIPVIEMIKREGKIKIISNVNSLKAPLLVEDLCTKGTGFTETVRELRSEKPDIKIIPAELVILNRGGLRTVYAYGTRYTILAAATCRVNDWDPEECPLHKKGSKSIKPKETEENWRLITTAQL